MRPAETAIVVVALHRRDQDPVGAPAARVHVWVSSPRMRIAIATDHAGFPLKAPIVDLLRAAGHEPVDFGTMTTDPVDYPDMIAPAARAVAAGDCDLGIVLGGSGTGEQIVANKIVGIRCVEAADPVTARLGREHNDANVLAMGATDHRQRGRARLCAGLRRGHLPGWTPRTASGQDPGPGSATRTAFVRRSATGALACGSDGRGPPTCRRCR